MEGCAPSSQKSRLYLWVAQEKSIKLDGSRREENKKKSTFPQLPLSCWPLLCVCRRFLFSILLPVFSSCLVDSSHLAGSCFYVLVCNQDEQLARPPLMGRLNRKHWVGGWVGGEPPDDNAILSLYPPSIHRARSIPMTPWAHQWRVSLLIFFFSPAVIDPPHSWLFLLDLLCIRFCKWNLCRELWATFKSTHRRSG